MAHERSLTQRSRKRNSYKPSCGDVAATMVKGSLDIRTSYNPITVTLPAGVEPRITVRTELGRVRPDYPVYIVDTGEGGVRTEALDLRVPPNAVVVRLENSSADIVIKK